VQGRINHIKHNTAIGVKFPFKNRPVKHTVSMLIDFDILEV